MSNGERIVVVASTSWDGVPMSERHIAVHLSRVAPVLWIDPALSRLGARRSPGAGAALDRPRLVQVADRIHRVSPITVPGITRPFLRSVGQRQVRSAIVRAVRELGGGVRATIVAGLDDHLDAVPGALSVFYGTDDYVAGAGLMGVNAEWIRRTLHRQLAKADKVVAVSDVLRDQWAPMRSDVEVIPNGCDVELFTRTDSAPLPSDVHLPGPVAGFVGHLSHRIDLDYLTAVADRGISLLLVGPRQPTFHMAGMDALIARPNVQWVGPKPFEELPSYLRCIDVGLTPYTTSGFNLASFPLKTLEYLAAGRAAVVTDLPVMQMLDTDLITIGRSPSEFAEATARALRTPRSPGDVDRRRDYAGLHSWSRRAADMARLIGLPTGVGSHPLT